MQTKQTAAVLRCDAVLHCIATQRNVDGWVSWNGKDGCMRQSWVDAGPRHMCSELHFEELALTVLLPSLLIHFLGRDDPLAHIDTDTADTDASHPRSIITTTTTTTTVYARRL